MNTSTTARNALRSYIDAPSDASKASPENQPPAAKTQAEYAAQLFWAIKSRDADAVIRFAAKVDDLDSHFEGDCAERPLTLAARYDLPVAALEVLLARSNPRLADAEGCTPLIFAAWGDKPHSSELVRLLLPASDPLALRKGTDSALCFAIRVQCSKTISLLLPVSDLGQRNMNGRTPLEQARQAGKDEVVKLILGEMARREALVLAAEISTAPGLSEALSASPRL